MQLVELAFTVPVAGADAVDDSVSSWTAALIEAGAGGVEERDAGTLDKAPPGTVTLVVWIEPAMVEAFLDEMRAAESVLGEALVARRDRDDDEWRDAWKRHFKARAFGRFVIVPSWETYAPSDGEIVLDMDPGRAFGTGGHASTQLCLMALSEVELAPGRFADIGCGSGVLAIAAARRWPSATGEAMDLDPDAVDVSHENAVRNRVDGRIRLSTDAVETLRGPFDVILANIQPEVLIPLAPSLASQLAAGGRIFLSGILVEAAAPVVAAYAAAGLFAVGERDLDGWRLLAFGR